MSGDHLTLVVSGPSCGSLSASSVRTDTGGHAVTHYQLPQFPMPGYCVIRATDASRGTGATEWHTTCGRQNLVFVTAEPTRLPADGRTTSAVTADYADCSGIAGAVLTLTLSGAACGSISPASGTTDLGGAVRATYRASTVPGTCTIAAAGGQGGGEGVVVTQASG